MNQKELKLKTESQLRVDLSHLMTLFKELLFKNASGQLKNIREIRSVRKKIAQINTCLKEKSV